MSASLLAIVMSVTLVAPAPNAGTPSGGSAYAEAVEAWQAEDWPRAADAFGRAFAQEPKKELLWGQAQALRFAERWADAIDAYERFIALDPPEVDIANARTNIARCRAKLEAEAPTIPSTSEPSPPAPRVVAHPEPPPVEHGDAPKTRRVDAPALGLLLGGIAGLPVGAGLVAYGQVRARRADDAATERGYRSAIADARTPNAIGIAFLAAGGALLVGSVIRWALVRRDRSGPQGREDKSRRPATARTSALLRSGR